MTENSKTNESSTAVDIALGIFALLCLAAVVKVVLWAYDLICGIIHFVDKTITMLGKGLVLLGLIILTAFVIAALLDALAPVLSQWRKRRNIRNAISRCTLPKLRTFRGQKSDSEVDQWLAGVVLAQRYFDLFGTFPGPSAFRNQDADYALFRAQELPRALLGFFPLVVEQYIFTRVYEAYRSGDEKVTKWINDAIVAVKKRHPLRCMGRVSRIVSFKFGFRSGEGFKRETVEERSTDQRFIFEEILWLHFWPNAGLLEQWVDLDLGMADEPETLPAPDKSQAVPLPARPMLLLPAPSGKPVTPSDPAPAPDEKRVGEEQDDDHVSPAELAEEAVAAVQAVVDRWNRDDPALDHPAETLREDEEILLAALPFHPEPKVVHEQLAQNRMRRERLKTFETDFDAEMNRDGGANDTPFAAPWLAAAVMELNGNMDPKQFKRLALRHYLHNVPPQVDDHAPQPETDDKATQPEHSAESTTPAPKAEVNAKTKTADLNQQKINHHPAGISAMPLYIPDGL